ncbi:universal stress protein [Shinella sp. S4-D37]|uniref:universal stress protein n=1 Tax=Shinella sp. S4-D37 TaxID=3161999 RepID=UPI00346656C7
MFEPKDLTVYLDAMDSEQHSERLSYAATFAKLWSAHLVVAYCPQDIALDLYAGYVRGAAIRSFLDARNEWKVKSEETLRDLIARTNEEFEITCELRICEGELGESLMLHARHTSLSVLGVGRHFERRTGVLDLSQDVIFASGRPTVLLPAGWQTHRLPEKIVVGWNASREAARAIADAMPFLSRAKAVHLVVVPEPKIIRLLGQDPGADISLHLARSGVSVTLDRIEGRDAGRLMMDRAREIGAELIVMGAYGQPKVSEFVFGSATKTLLSSSEIPILLSR